MYILMDQIKKHTFESMSRFRNFEADNDNWTTNIIKKNV